MRARDWDDEEQAPATAAIAEARALSELRAIYRQADMEQLQLAPDSVDLVYSSLALHYIERLDALIGQVYGALAPGASFVFSVEHPIYTAPSSPGFTEDASGRRTWPVDFYLAEGPRSTDWLARGVIKQHRTIATYLNMLLRAGFALRHLEEWGPTEAQIAEVPAWADERQRPPFLLVAARRS